MTPEQLTGLERHLLDIVQSIVVTLENEKLNSYGYVDQHAFYLESIAADLQAKAASIQDLRKCIAERSATGATKN